MNPYKSMTSRLQNIHQKKSKNPHILIIDDDEIFCLVLTDMLKKTKSYDVSSTLDSKKGLELLKKSPDKFDLILLDRMMPEISGLDILNQLSPLLTLKSIPVIMLTSHAGRSHIETAANYGVFETLYKPIDNIILLDTVKKALKKRSYL